MGMDLFEGDDPWLGIFAFMQGVGLEESGEGEEEEAGRKEDTEVEVELAGESHSLLAVRVE